MEEFNNMDDEQFRKEFLKFLEQHEKKMNEFMKKMYDPKPKKDTNFNKLNDYINNMMNGLDNTFGDIPNPQFGSWNLPNDSFMYRSYNNDVSPFDLFNKKNENKSTMDILDDKLKKSIIEEDYESAIKIRDLINGIKEDQKKSKN